VISQTNSIRIPLPDQSVQCVVTSPPYWSLRNYQLPSTEWPTVTYTPMAGLPAVTVPGCDPECKHEWGEEASVTVGRNDEGPEDIARRFEQYGTGRDKALTANNPREASQGQWCQRCGGWRGCLGLEPTPEMFVAHIVAVFREVWRVLRDDGTCWVNFGDSYATTAPSTVVDPGKMTGKHTNKGAYRRPPTAPGVKPKDLCGIPWRVAFALQADGWYLRNDIIWHKPNPMPESVRDRCTKAHEYLFLMAKSARYHYDADAVREAGEGYGRSERFRGSGYENNNSFNNSAKHKTTGGGKSSYDGSGRNRRDVWSIATRPYSGAHFATFPPDLVLPCVQAGTPQEGACPVCGAPWERVVERMPTTGRIDHELTQIAQLDTGIWGGRCGDPHSQTIGWRPTCDHNADPVPAIVLDPFCGSGTVGAVCRETGRRFVGLDLNPTYLAELALPRAENKTAEHVLEELPLFAMEEEK